MVRRRTPRNFDTLFEYDAFARKTKETDANATFSTWTYDAFGRLTAHAEMVNSSAISSYFTAGGAVHGYTYDEAGLLLALEDTDELTADEATLDAALLETDEALEVTLELTDEAELLTPDSGKAAQAADAPAGVVSQESMASCW
jgi:YD repeat-containing protein